MSHLILYSIEMYFDVSYIMMGKHQSAIQLAHESVFQRPQKKTRRPQFITSSQTVPKVHCTEMKRFLGGSLRPWPWRMSFCSNKYVCRTCGVKALSDLWTRGKVVMNCFSISLTVGDSNSTLQWRHNERDGVSNHQPHDCLLKRLFRGRSNFRVTDRCEGIHLAQRASNAENVSIWWRHYDYLPWGSKS